MLTLVIDTATDACSVALMERTRDGERLLGDSHEIIGRGHAERLIPMIAALPDGGRADRILVDVGPGSFTGIRVGIAAARALGFAWNARVAGYSSMALIALDQFSFAQRCEAFAVALEGGHGEVFVQRFAGRPDFGALDDVVSLKPAEALARIGTMDVVGTGVTRLADLPAAQRGASIRPWAALMPMMPGDYCQLPAKPFYGRAPDAKLPGGITP